MPLVTDSFHKNKLANLGINIKTNYIVGNKIYRGGKYVETFEESEEHCIDGIDEMILRLIELDRPLKPIMCYN